MGKRNADQVKKDLASCEKQRKAAKAKQERREKELAAKAAKDKKPDICECDEASPATLAWVVSCGKEAAPGMDGTDLEWLWFSFKLPGDSTHHEIFVEVTPSDCKAEGNGDSAKEIAEKAAKEIRRRQDNGSIPHGTMENMAPILVASTIVSDKKNPDKNLHVAFIRFGRVCCVDFASSNAKVGAYMFKGNGANRLAAWCIMGRDQQGRPFRHWPDILGLKKAETRNKRTDIRDLISASNGHTDWHWHKRW